MTSHINNYHTIRLNKLIERGYCLYTENFFRSCGLIDIRQDFSHVKHIGETIDFRLCGRIEHIEYQDAAIYISAEDRSARLRFAIQPAWVGAEAYEAIAFLQPGDYIGFCTDRIYRTSTNELTARVRDWFLLAPFRVNLPEDTTCTVTHSPYAFTDYTTRRRIRARPMVTRMVRRFIEDEMEIDEMRLPRDAKNQPVYSQNTHFANLSAGDFENTYEINELPTEYVAEWSGYPELQRLNCRIALFGIEDLKELSQRLIMRVARQVYGHYEITWIPHHEINWSLDAHRPEQSGREIRLDLSAENWRTLTFNELVTNVTGVDFALIKHPEEALAAAHGLGVTVSEHAVTVGEIAVCVARALAFSTLIQPTYVIEYPTEAYPLVRRHTDKPEAAEYFEVFINGVKLASGESCLTNPDDLQEKTPNPMRGSQFEFTTGDHIEAMTYGIPPTGGLQLAIDRLAMMVTGCTSLRELIYIK